MTKQSDKCPMCKHALTVPLPTKCPHCRTQLGTAIKVSWKQDGKSQVVKVVRPPTGKLTLGGTLFLYNGIQADYCFEQTLACMVELCDQIVLIECYSTDGSYEALQRWASLYPSKIRLERQRWMPNAGGKWLCDLTNEARQMLTTEMHLLMGADEVIHPSQYQRVRDYTQAGRMVQFRRFNFRGSPWHITPIDRGGGGDWFRRLGPQQVPAECDGGELADIVGTVPARESKLTLFHYGQIRTAEGFITKHTNMLAPYWGPATDNLMEEVRKHGMKMLCESASPAAVPWADMVPWQGEHPPSMVPWLRERGYEV